MINIVVKTWENNINWGKYIGDIIIILPEHLKQFKNNLTKIYYVMPDGNSKNFSENFKFIDKRPNNTVVISYEGEFCIFSPIML